MQPRGSRGQWRGRENPFDTSRKHGVVRHEAFGARRWKYVVVSAGDQTQLGEGLGGLP